MPFPEDADAEPLPPTPENPEEVEDHRGEFVDEEDDPDDDDDDGDYHPSPEQESGSRSSASFFNPSSQNLEVRYCHIQLVLKVG